MPPCESDQSLLSGSLNVHGYWDLLWAMTKNPGAKSVKNVHKHDEAANWTVTTLVEKWWFHVLTSCYHCESLSWMEIWFLNLHNSTANPCQRGAGESPAVPHPLCFTSPYHLGFIGEVLFHKTNPNLRAVLAWELGEVVVLMLWLVLPPAVTLPCIALNQNEKPHVFSFPFATHS